MPEITATEFKARCLELMDRVRERGETYVITKRGRRVAKLAPPDPEPRRASFLGCLRGEIEIVGDITGPTAALESWNATISEWAELDEPRGEKAKRKRSRRA